MHQEILHGHAVTMTTSLLYVSLLSRRVPEPDHHMGRLHGDAEGAIFLTTMRLPHRFLMI